MNPLDEIRTAFKDFEEEALQENLQTALQEGADPLEIVGALTEMLEEIGEEFAKGNLFLPDMMMAGEQMKASMEQLRPAIVSANKDVPKGGKVVLGTVAGDIHDIGKNMVKTMLTVAGFEVIDLGVNVSAAQFYTAVQNEQPAVVALSSCMTTTMPSMADTVALLKNKGLAEKVKIVVGGGSMNPSRAADLGCIYGGHDAFEAAKVLKNITA